MDNIEEIISRFKKVHQLKTDKKMAEMLGLSQPDFAKRKKTGTLLKIIVQRGINQNVNLNWLLAGRGDPRELPEDEENEPVLSFGFGGELEHAEASGLYEILGLAAKVLRSGNDQAAEALEKNIRYFAHAVEVEKRLENVERRLLLIEEALKREAG